MKRRIALDLRNCLRIAFLALIAAVPNRAAEPPYQVKSSHPRLVVEDVATMARRSTGPLAEDYRIVKERADEAVRRGGIEFIDNRWAIPEDLMNCGLAYLVERELGHESRRYADVIIKQWGDGKIISDPKGSHFGYHALAYDWIYDALTPEQRVRFGNALGSWLRFFTESPEIQLKWGHWEYNQTWGPIHLNIMNSRDALTQKLFIALAIHGAGTDDEADARSFLDSWAKRVPTECLPAFDRMGGVWSESYGHGSYGPVTVIPYAFQAWRTATGLDYFKQLRPWGYPIEEPRWIAYTMMPHDERTAWIDDGDGSKPSAFARAAPMLHDSLSQWFSDRGRSWLRERWQRVACLDPSIPATSPDHLPLAYLFPGAGHVYMRSAWNDPDATWAFFGCGPQFAGHARDDEGHFLICKRGALVSRQGGQGPNDSDYYAGGSLIYNIVTIFDPNEKFRRDRGNENDGGLLRHVYESDALPRDRGHIVAFENTPDFTYTAADITAGYNPNKAREVTRQFLYLRGKREFFVVFDRVQATHPEFRRHFFLHVPTAPEGQGRQLSWLSSPEADGDKSVLSHGRSRLFLTSVLPLDSEVVTRGGPGKEAWGHPLEPTAQYNHLSPGRLQPPICPWRIEVGDPTAGARTLFLHVLEVGEEADRQPTIVKFVPPAGVQIGDRWSVQFNPEGPLGGKVDGSILTSAVRNEGQYAEASQRAANSSSRPPIALLDPPEQGFFSKQLDFHGIPIKAHRVVADEALEAAYDRLSLLLTNLLVKQTLVLSNLVAAGVELHIIGRDQVTTDLPEWRQDKGVPLAEYHGLTRDQRTRGMGGRLTSCGEENLLHLEKDRYRGRDICLHEFSHSVLNYGCRREIKTRFAEQLRRSLAKNRWVHSYAGSNSDEFFAELTMWYFGTHGDLGMTGPKPANGRDGLKAYDPDAFALLDDFYSGRIPIGQSSAQRRQH